MQIDTTYVQQVQHTRAYDYLSDIQESTSGGVDAPHLSWNWLYELFESQEARVFGTVVILLLLFALVWRILSRMGLGGKDDVPEAGLGQDTIYGHDWDTEISQMMDAGRYGEVAVLCYLRWLANMEGKGIIVYHASKTPNLYQNEIDHNSQMLGDSAPTVRETTRRLTRHYLEVRYGHRDIGRDTAETLVTL